MSGEGPDPTLWPQVLSHSHHLRGKGMNLADTNAFLVAWCREHGIRAFGLGSPWEPNGAAACMQFEGPDRESYDAGEIDPASVKHEAETLAVIEELNRLSDGDTLFYLDNETPKARYGHLWWFNWHFDVPSWHDYSQDRQIQYYRFDPDTELNPRAGRPFQRRPYLEVLRHQRSHGALGIWAHPTSWWRNNGHFVTNIAAEAGLHLLCQGRLDGLVVMGYDVCQPAYPSLWFDWLDTGAVIPGFAESDQANNQLHRPGGNDCMVTRLNAPHDLSLPAITASAAAGQGCATTGGILNLHTDTTPMGGVETVPPGTEIQVHVEVLPPPEQSVFSMIHLIGRGGQVLSKAENVAAGRLSFTVTMETSPGWLVARGYGEHDSPRDIPPEQVRHLTLSNPVYLHPPGFRFETARTALELSVQPGSRYHRQCFRVHAFNGELLQEGVLDRSHTLDLPADAWLEFPDLDDPWPLYPCMENQAVQDLLAYLWKGAFLQDFSGCGPGQIPPEAWRLPELRNALREQTLML